MPHFRLDPRGVAVVLLLLTGIMGILAGIMIDRTLLTVPHVAAPPVAPRASHGRDDREWRDERVPGGMRRHYAERMARDLALTPEQRTRIDSILRAQQEQVRALRRETTPRFKDIADDTRTAIRAVLTPQQRERWQTLRQRWRGSAEDSSQR
jgi:Spy/CpxP family protein refolding chaperone